jgi:hypothetical protein
LEYLLEKIYNALLVVLEAAGLPQNRNLLIATWDIFRKQEKKGLRYTECDPAYDSCESPALTFVEQIIAGLRMTASPEVSSEEAWILTRLDAMLRKTAVLVRRRGVVPENELQAQAVMEDYLSASFASFTKKLTISGAVKSSKPDFGIADVGAAIEFKIAHTEQEAKTAFSGIAEDTAGYKGSKDWTKFFGVVYQAGPFTSEDSFNRDLKRMGAFTTWTLILVNHETKKPQKRSAIRRGQGKRAKTTRK